MGNLIKRDRLKVGEAFQKVGLGCFAANVLQRLQTFNTNAKPQTLDKNENRICPLRW